MEYHVELLCIAAERGSAHAVMAVFEKDGVMECVNERGEDGKTAVFIAAENGNHAALKVLLQFASADVTVTSTRTGELPLCVAAKKGHTRALALLLGEGDNRINDGTCNALCAAADFGQEESVAMLLSHSNINVNKQSCVRDGSALCIASRRGHLGIVRRLLKSPIDVNAVDRNGATALYEAARGGYVEVVALLLGHGVDVDVLTIDTMFCANPSESALDAAVAAGNMDVVTMLLDRGCRPLSSLFYAAREGHVEVAELLLEQPGVYVNGANSDGETPLFDAAYNGHVDMMAMLIRMGADVNHLDNYHSSLLTITMDKEVGETAAAALLLATEGLDVNRGYFHALGVATSHRRADFVAMLLAHGEVDVNAANDSTALHTAAIGGLDEIVALLLGHESLDLNKVDGQGRTALEFAMEAVEPEHDLGPAIVLLCNAPGANRRTFVRHALSETGEGDNTDFLLKTGHGHLDLCGMDLTDEHVERLARRLALCTGVTAVDLRCNDDIGEPGVYALEMAASNNVELLFIRCDAGQMRLQAAVHSRQIAFLNRACVFLRELNAMCAERNLPSQQVAQIGAMAFGRYVVPRGPRLYERAEAMLLSLLM
jgi:ankyrin repeat protein